MNDGDQAGARDDPPASPASEAFESIGDLPRRAAEQAGSIVARLMQGLEMSGDADRLATGEADPADPSMAQLRAAFGRAVDLYLDLFQRTLDSYMGTMETAMRRRGFSATAEHGGAVQLETSSDGRADGVVFLHNYSGADAASPPVRVTDLTAADGAVIASGEVRVEQPGATIDDRSTVRVGLVVRLDGAAPGVYFGHVLAGGDAIAVRLTVPAP